MAVRSREELLASINARLGDDTSDDALALLDDITDTMTDLENRANNNTENWEQRYRENDAAWRQKYRDRFFSSGDDDVLEPASQFEPEPPKNYTFENLFKEG